MAQKTENCALDRSQCAAATQCGHLGVQGACSNIGNSLGSICTDGCTYTSGGFTVAQETSGSRTFIDNFLSSSNVGFSHRFTAGAEGALRYNFEPGFQDDLTLVPALGGACTFHFNGDACLCEQRYCDASQSTYGNFIDCSGLEGGSVIDVCNNEPSLTTESPLMETLFWLPFVTCAGNADTEEAPTPGNGSAGTSSSENRLRVGVSIGLSVISAFAALRVVY